MDPSANHQDMKTPKTDPETDSGADSSGGAGAGGAADLSVWLIWAALSVWLIWAVIMLLAIAALPSSWSVFCLRWFLRDVVRSHRAASFRLV